MSQTFAEIRQEVFAERPNVPLPAWANKNVVLSRRQSSIPGPYDPNEFPWTWEFQEIMRTRKVYEDPAPDGSVIIRDPPDSPGDSATVATVTQITVMKCSQSGYTESVLNAIRYFARHDPQNVIFAIDSRDQASTVNEIRLQPTLRALGAQIFTENKDDTSKFLLKLRNMLVYFVGSYSPAAFASKMAEFAVADELEEHALPPGDASNVENLRGRIKTSSRGLLVLLSKPKMAGGPIDVEFQHGSMHVPEIACPHCGGWQELKQDNMIFDHCKNLLGQWDFERVKNETYFRCEKCEGKIEDKHRPQINRRENRRWRRTNLLADRGHISFRMSDFYATRQLLPTWGILAQEYIESTGNQKSRQGYRNNHEGLPYEERATKTLPADILALRGDHKLGTIPWKPDLIILGADVGLEYVKWTVHAQRHLPDGQSEAAIIDYGKELHPDDLLTLIRTKRYKCHEDQEDYIITVGGCDAKYRKDEVTRACLNSQRKLFPTAGINADLAVRSISFNSKPPHPPWFGVIVYVDRDAKHELYTDRIAAWSANLQDPSQMAPQTGRLIFPQEINQAEHWPFVNEFTQEHLVEIPTAHAAKQFVWKRKGPNHWADAVKVALVLWRYLTRNDPIK